MLRFRDGDELLEETRSTIQNILIVYRAMPEQDTRATVRVACMRALCHRNQHLAENERVDDRLRVVDLRV